MMLEGHKNLERILYKPLLQYCLIIPKLFVTT